MEESKRIIYYYQTFTGINNILELPNVVTHIHLSSIHFGLNNNTPYIHLNDNDPFESSYDSVWKQLLKFKKTTKNGKVLLMVGGAGSAFTNLFSDFEVYYNLLKNVINVKRNIIDGIDLDIEEQVSYINIKRLISRLKLDFGTDFMITMAPIQYALQTDNPGLGGFSYKELYKDIGHFIDYFNGQFYEDYSETAYTQVIENGYPENKIVMGSISSQNLKSNLEVITNLSKKYPNFGGVYNWEYFDSPPNSNNPALWALMIQQAIN
jgi:chitinase